MNNIKIYVLLNCHISLKIVYDCVVNFKSFSCRMMLNSVCVSIYIFYFCLCELYVNFLISVFLKMCHCIRSKAWLSTANLQVMVSAAFFNYGSSPLQLKGTLFLVLCLFLFLLTAVLEICFASSP